MENITINKHNLPIFLKDSSNYKEFFEFEDNFFISKIIRIFIQ